MGRKTRRGVENKSLPVDMKPKSGFVFDLAVTVAAVIVALVPFCYGKYIEFNMKGAFDGGLNAYSAKCLLDGQKLGVDVFPSARPATLLVNVIGVGLFGYNEFGPKLIQLIMQAGAFCLMFCTVRKIFGVVPAAFCLVLAVFYLNCPPYAKVGNAKEQYMIASMITAACSIMMYHYGGKWRWLLVCGAAAINAYYFKPTAMSVIAAIVVYHFFQPVLKHCKWRRYARELVFLSAGTAVGIVPLMLFNLWQGTLGKFMNEFPASLVKLIIVCFVIYAAARLLLVLAIRTGGKGFEEKLKKLPWGKIGAVFLVLFAGLVLFVIFGRGPGGPVKAIKNIPVIGMPVQLLLRVIAPMDKLLREATGSGIGYVSESKQASVFAKQFVDVFKYYHSSFAAPIGIGVLAILMWAVNSAVKIAGRLKPDTNRKPDVRPIKPIEPIEPQTYKTQPERFVLLLVVWWVLDMLFVWVSPRAYVEYFLPFNASSAMLAGYVVYKCIEKNYGWVLITAAWLAAEIIIAKSIKDVLFPAEGEFGNYIKGLWPQIAIVTGCAGVWFAGKKMNFKTGAAVVLAGLCVWSWYMYNEGNLKAFEAKVASADEIKNEGKTELWEMLSAYIKEHSDEDDRIYVWGWTPGIYVESNRFSSAKRWPAYGNMHSENPELVGRRINNLIKDFTAEPPKFIVDSQKIHYPFFDHPVFDLWPCWQDRKSGKPHLRVYPNQGYNYRQAFTVEEYDKYRGALMAMVQGWTKSILTQPNRLGGPLTEEKASKLAETERARHEAMEPLRKYVMENYRLCPTQYPGFVLFERK